MQQFAPWAGLFASTILSLLCIVGLFIKHKEIDPLSEFNKVPSSLLILMLLFGFFLSYLCYLVLFDDSQAWLIQQLAKLFT